ncbi:MAG: hypothetical protein FWB79_03685 [Treponema sp.]|nr:hypothetical protein [Treponema sp.]
MHEERHKMTRTAMAIVAIVAMTFALLPFDAFAAAVSATGNPCCVSFAENGETSCCVTTASVCCCLLARDSTQIKILACCEFLVGAGCCSGSYSFQAGNVDGFALAELHGVVTEEQSGFIKITYFIFKPPKA